MNKPKVFIANQIPPEAEKYIGQYCDYEKWTLEHAPTEAELIGILSDKDGIITAGMKIDENTLKHAPKLKVISNISVGYNNLDIEALKARKVLATNTPYVLDDTVADLIVGLILSASRRIAELDKYVKDGLWNGHSDISLFGVDVHHSTVGIIGMGRIGQTVAKRLRFGFDAEVMYYNRHKNTAAEDSLGVKYAELEELLSKSDFIVLMPPFTKETYHLIDYKEFAKMKSSAILINASRGQVINEDALIDALQNKKILGAGLDVYEKEPVDSSNPLLKMCNVVTLPHIGSATEKTRFNMSMTAAESLVAVLSEGCSPNIIPELKFEGK